MASFTTVQSGDWDDPATWGEATDYPSVNTGDTVTINNGYDVTYNIDNSSGNAIAYINITGTGSSLIMDDTMDTYLKMAQTSSNENIDMSGDTNFLIGTSGSPLSSSYTCTIEGSSLAANGYGIINNTNNGLVAWYGAEKTHKGLTTSLISASGTSFTMSSVPADWAADDELAILPTGNTYSETDYVSITSIVSNTVNIDATTYSHLSGAIVLNLTRNIILKGGATAPKNGLGGGNSSFILEYVRIQDIRSSNSTSEGALACANQGIEDRDYSMTGLVVTDNMSAGMVGANGTGTHEKSIFINNYSGVHGQNDWGYYKFNDCFFVDNNVDGLSSESRGAGQVSNSVICGNADDGMVAVRGTWLLLNTQIYANNDYGLDIESCLVEAHGCLFGESDIGTQRNGDADLNHYQGGILRSNDCKFSSLDEWDVSSHNGQTAVHSNYQQTEDNYKCLFLTRGQDMVTIEDDTTTYRTTSPSLKFANGAYLGDAYHKIPIKVDSGDVVSASVYGKKSSSTGWEHNPTCRMIGCGIDDSDTFDDADVNWNQKTLSGTASRGGVVTFFVFAGDASNDFNIDDFEVSIT